MEEKGNDNNINENNEVIQDNKKTKKMINLKYIIIIFIIIIMIAIAITLFVRNKINDESEGKNTGEERVLIVNEYINYAWEFTYYGYAICENGNIYEFEFEEREDYLETSNLEEKSKNILDNTTKKIGKVSDEDLKELKNYLENVTDDCESTVVSIDAGEEYINYFDYDDNTEITLDGYGDEIIKNNSENIDTILEILDEYELDL